MLPAGGAIVISAVALLHTFSAQGLFAGAGVGVEILGLILMARAHAEEKEGM